jgi:hypothetical protein
VSVGTAVAELVAICVLGGMVGTELVFKRRAAGDRVSARNFFCRRTGWSLASRSAGQVGGGGRSARDQVRRVRPVTGGKEGIHHWARSVNKEHPNKLLMGRHVFLHGWTVTPRSDHPFSHRLRLRRCPHSLLRKAIIRRPPPLASA